MISNSRTKKSLKWKKKERKKSLEARKIIIRLKIAKGGTVSIQLRQTIFKHMTNGQVVRT